MKKVIVTGANGFIGTNLLKELSKHNLNIFAIIKDEQENIDNIKDIKGVKIVYCGSLIQQNMGENISGHGGVIWDVENKTWEPFDLNDGEYGYYKFAINNPDDIDNNMEKILNL